MKLPTLFLCLSFAGTSAQLQAASPDANPEPVVTAGEIKAPGADERFLVDASQGNAAEIQLANLALEKSSNAQVRDLAERIKKDHSTAQEELTVVATGLNVEIPSEPSVAQKQTYERLSGLEGQEFDAAYLEVMQDEHVKTIREFESVAEKTDTPVVRAYAERTLKALKTHHEKVEAARKSAND